MESEGEREERSKATTTQAEPDRGPKKVIPFHSLIKLLRPYYTSPSCCIAALNTDKNASCRRVESQGKRQGLK